MIVNNEVEKDLYLRLSEVASDRAAIYRILSQAVYNPTARLAESLIKGNVYTDVSCSVNWVNSTSNIFDVPLQKLKEVSESLSVSNDEELLSEMKVEFTRLFSEANEPVIAKHETNMNGKEIDGTSVKQKIESVFDKEGFAPIYDSSIEVDFIGAELQYLMYLCEKEAGAWIDGKMGIAKQSKRKQREFLVNHLGKWGERFFINVVNAAKLDVYIAFGMLGTNFIRLEKGH